MCLNPYLVHFCGLGAVILGHTILLEFLCVAWQLSLLPQQVLEFLLLSFLDCSAALNPVLFIWPRAFQDRTRVGIQICIGWRGTCGNLEGYWTIGRSSGQWKKYHEKTSLDQKSVYRHFLILLGFPGGSEVKTSACNAGDPGSIPGSGISPREGNGSPLQHSCLENLMDRGAWWAMVHSITHNRTQLKRLSKHVCICITDSFCPTPETNTTLWINYTPIKIRVCSI